MQIENEKLVLAPLNPVQIEREKVLRGTKQALPLTADQLRMLKWIRPGATIQEAIAGSIQTGVLPTFRELYWLLEFMARQGLIMNPHLREFFQARRLSQMPETAKVPVAAAKGPVVAADLKNRIANFPFFRSLKDSELLKLLFQQMKVRPAGTGVYVCRQGQVDRHLYVLIQGQASVYRDIPSGGVGRVGVLHAGAVFGEVGFFMGEARTAHVMADEECLVAQIEYRQEIFGRVVSQEKAGQLQKRLWVLHSLLRSPLFRDLSPDSFDALIFAGELRSFKAGDFVCRENESGHSCHIVVGGEFNVTQGPKYLRRLGQGESFGEIALMKTGGSRTANVQAIGPAMTLEVGFEKFYPLLSENLILACQFERLAESRLTNGK